MPKEKPPDAKSAVEEKKNRKWLILGAVATVVLIFLYMRSKSSSSGSPISSPAPTGFYGSPGGTAPSGSGGSGNQMAMLQAEVAGLVARNGQTMGSKHTQVAHATPTGAGLLGSEQLYGGGYLPPGVKAGSSGPYHPSTITSSKGNTYSWLQTGAQAKAAVGSGTSLYYQPQPGMFSQVQSNQITHGGFFTGKTPTPLYERMP